jgi:hypothetical protein
MSVWGKLRGISESLFQLGLSGPQLKNNAGPPVAIEHRDSTDSGFVISRGADPSTGVGSTADNDHVTKHYDDKRFSRTFLLMGG